MAKIERDDRVGRSVGRLEQIRAGSIRKAETRRVESSVNPDVYDREELVMPSVHESAKSFWTIFTLKHGKLDRQR